jgi:flagellar basal body L-ring protein FlgH
MKVRLFTWWLMRTLSSVSVWLLAWACLGDTVFAQSSSLFRKVDANAASLAANTQTNALQQVNTAQTTMSYFAVKPLPKRLYKIGDLVSVIVRQKSSFKHDGKTDVSRDTKIKAELNDWVRFKDGRLIAATPPEGDPKINFKMGREFQGEGEVNRTNEVVTRITCKVMDVMPNGNLVLQGGPDIIETDGEKQIITLTGTCRAEDILPDNTIISTQLLECNFKNENTGAVRDAMQRGWITRAWDFLRPF